MKKLFFSITFLLLTGMLFAQNFDLSAELRPRFESKHGYKALSTKDADAANFISQRTRLNFDYSQSKVKAHVTLQNVRVWGEASTLSPADKANSFHEAWAEAKLNSKWSLKMGRQEIVYDDHRIFGNVGWAQQARSHDAFLVKFMPMKGHRLDLGFALNADSQAGVKKPYSNAAGYKNFQYAWYHGNFGGLGLSVLALNTGFENTDANGDPVIDNMQTIGPRLTYKMGALSANAAAYFQTGKNVYDVASSYFAADLGYKLGMGLKLGVGFEQLSGKDKGSTDTKITSFAPLFGTNHRFNGWMDYFYVGNHANSVGLTDIYGSVVYKKNKFSAKVIPHLFSAAADVLNANGEKMDKNLGTEIDIALGYKLSSSVSFSAGYSQMLATETMEVLRGGDKDANNRWIWAMFVFKPSLFSFFPHTH